MSLRRTILLFGKYCTFHSEREREANMFRFNNYRPVLQLPPTLSHFETVVEGCHRRIGTFGVSELCTTKSDVWFFL